jgi:signal transduction histidine kinase
MRHGVCLIVAPLPDGRVGDEKAVSKSSPRQEADSELAPLRIKGRSVRTQILYASCSVLVPMVLALGFLVFQLERMREATLAIKSAYEAIDVGHRLQAKFKDTEMAVHAFALTGDQHFLTAYRDGRREWSVIEIAASGLIRSRPEDFQNRFIAIEGEVDDFFMQWEEHLGTFAPGSNDPQARELIRDDRERAQRIGESIADFVRQQESDVLAVLAREERERSRAYYGTVLTSVGSVVLLVVFAIVMGRAIAWPIWQVSEAARLLGEGHWDQRVVPRGGRETRVLAAAFNRMADALKEARESLAARNQDLEETALRLAMLNDDLRDRQKESEDFLYVLSHDLRAPLINIQGFAKRLHNSMNKLETGLSNGGAPEDAEAHLKKMTESLKFINAGTTKIDQLIARLLEIARLTTRPNEACWTDMEAMARHVVDACQFQLQERSIQARVGELPYVFGDPTQLNQVLTNLVDNAIKYMGDRPEKRIDITCSPVGDRYRFAVQDTGPGISRDNKEKVFRMFTRLAPGQAKGEGIGLAAVRTIVNRHRGRIWVESTEGVGSTFYFTLPKNPDGASPKPGEAFNREAQMQTEGEESGFHA